MEKRQVVVGVVEQEVPQVVEEHGHGDHVEKLEHEVEDNEVVVVSPLAGEGPVLAKCQSEVMVQVLSARSCQKHWAAEVESSMSSEAKSSAKVARRAGETKVSIPFQ